MPDILILGAGVIGLSTAYHLAKRNVGRITVIDKGPIGDGSSSRAAGICTGLLWSEAGVLVRKRCFELYDELSADLPGYSFRRTGCLALFGPADWEERRKLLTLYDRLGVPYQILQPATWPGLQLPENSIGLYDPKGGYSEPAEYLPALTRSLRASGVTILENQAASGFLLSGGKVRGVQTSEGPIEADAVICAVYGWTRLLLAQLGIQVAVKAFVHQRYELEIRSSLPPMPAVNANPLGIYFRPALDGRVLVGIETVDRPEFHVPDPHFRLSSLNCAPEVRDAAVARLVQAIPGLAVSGLHSESIGLLTFSLDGEPILGPVTEYPGLYLGLAFHSGGFAYNPAAGELLADYVAQGYHSIDVSSWHPGRFASAESDLYLGTQLTQAQSFRRRH